jgi:hypothetical protein
MDCGIHPSSPAARQPPWKKALLAARVSSAVALHQNFC